MCMSRLINVFGEPLEVCSLVPLTGFTRRGDCETGLQDAGAHVICCQMTREFLVFSRSRGNDLITPVFEHGFPGLKAGDRWCLCAYRWRDALEAGCAPPVILKSTHESALHIVTYQDLKTHALDLL